MRRAWNVLLCRGNGHSDRPTIEMIELSRVPRFLPHVLSLTAVLLSGCTLRLSNGGSVTGTHRPGSWARPSPHRPVAHAVAHRPAAARPAVAHRPTPAPAAAPREPAKPIVGLLPLGYRPSQLRPARPSKPGSVGPGSKPPGPHKFGALACVAAMKAAQAGQCEQALELLEKCDGKQRPAFVKAVAKHCPQ